MLGAAFVALVLGAGGLAVALYHYYRWTTAPALLIYYVNAHLVITLLSEKKARGCLPA